MCAFVLYLFAGAALASLIGFPLFVAIALISARNAILLDSTTIHAQPDENAPGVTVLKPCAGDDDDLEFCIESFCRLRYPTFQLIAGVNSVSDRAHAVLLRVRAKFPEVEMSIVVANSAPHLSPKISNLDAMSKHAKFGLFWLSDSNTRVHRDTLTSMVSDFQTHGVDCVTSSIVGVGEENLGAALSNIHMSAFVGGGTFVSNRLTGLSGTGKSVLLHCDTLERIGGWNELGRYSGDDVILFRRIRALGKSIGVGKHVVGEVCRRRTVAQYFGRHVRWTQIRLKTVPIAARFEPLLSPLIPATALALLAHNRISAALVTLALFEQLILDLATMRFLRGHGLRWRFVPLVALRPFVNVAIWLRALISARVDWRGNHFWIGKNSEILTERVTSRRSETQR